jgi:hypothetical protein
MFKKILLALLKLLGLIPLPRAVIDKNLNIMGEAKDCSPNCGACCIVLKIDQKDLQKPAKTRCPYLTENYECEKMLAMSEDELQSAKKIKQGAQSIEEFCGHWTCRKADERVKLALYEEVHYGTRTLKGKPNN